GGARGVGARGAPGERDAGSARTRRREAVIDQLERAIDDVGRRWVPDRRLGVFEVVVEGEPRRLGGRTTSLEALEALRRLAADRGRLVGRRAAGAGRGRPAPPADRSAGGAPSRRDGRAGGWPPRHGRRGERAPGGGNPGGSPHARHPGAGAALVRRRAVSVGRT